MKKVFGDSYTGSEPKINLFWHAGNHHLTLSNQFNHYVPLTFGFHTFGTSVSESSATVKYLVRSCYVNFSKGFISFLVQAWMSKKLSWRNAEFVTFSDMKSFDQHKVDFKMIKDDKILEPKKKPRNCSSLICLLTGVFIFGKINPINLIVKYRVNF